MMEHDGDGVVKGIKGGGRIDQEDKGKRLVA